MPRTVVPSTSHFDYALEKTLKWEGGFADHPNDPGGATNYGISLRTLRQLDDEAFDVDGDGDIDADDVRQFQLKHAKKFYRKYFWKHEYDQIESREVAAKIFDMAVNMGERQAVKLVQRAVNFTRHLLTTQRLAVDGDIGPLTVNAINTCRAEVLLEAIQAAQAEFYFRLTGAKPSRKVFLLGWLRRAYS